MDQGSHRQLPLDGAPARALGAVWDHTHSMTLPLPESAPARPARRQCTNAHSWDKPGTQGLDPQTSAYRGQALLCDQLLTVWPWPRFVTPLDFLSHRQNTEAYLSQILGPHLWVGFSPPPHTHLFPN